jgi:hypothetical protein
LLGKSAKESGADQPTGVLDAPKATDLVKRNTTIQLETVRKLNNPKATNVREAKGTPVGSLLLEYLLGVHSIGTVHKLFNDNVPH